MLPCVNVFDTRNLHVNMATSLTYALANQALSGTSHSSCHNMRPLRDHTTHLAVMQHASKDQGLAAQVNDPCKSLGAFLLSFQQQANEPDFWSP